jgi:diguanylate cyclase (GGDEF)-like protein
LPRNPRAVAGRDKAVLPGTLSLNCEAVLPMFLQMARWWATPEPDESFLQFRERSLRDGAWLTYVVALVVAAYAVATWQRPHRDAILALLVVAMFSGYVMARLPAAAIMRSRWRELFFLAWTTADLVLIALVVAADGGDWSPLRATFFLPLFFAALSYPARSVVATGVLAVVAYVGAAVLGGHATTETLAVFSALLSTAAVMGVSQAVNRERQRRELQQLSRSDPLTGTLNRRGFTERFAAQLSDHMRHDGRPLGLIVIDLDDFKRVNDTRGHAAGDDLLCDVARTLAADLRPSDVLGRLGGDEFAVLLPEAGPGELRAAVARLEQRLGDVAKASIGIASLPVDGLTADDLHRAADADLYRAKQRRAERAVESLA